MRPATPAKKPIVINFDTQAKFVGLILSVMAFAGSGGIAWGITQAQLASVQRQVEELRTDRDNSAREAIDWRDHISRSISTTEADVRWIRERLQRLDRVEDQGSPK